MQMQNAAEAPEGLEQQAESLGRLSWMFLRLLLARRTIGQVMGGAQNDADVQRKIAALERQQHQTGLSEELARSLSGQLEILKQRLQQRMDGDRKLAFIEAELERIQQQVELIREQAAMSTDPELSPAASTISPPRSARPASGFATSSRSTARWKTC